jgi:hypothetical protein
MGTLHVPLQNRAISTTHYPHWATKCISATKDCIELYEDRHHSGLQAIDNDETRKRKEEKVTIKGNEIT